MKLASIAGLLCLSMLACSNKQEGPCTTCKEGTGGVTIGFALTSADVVRVVASITGSGIPTPITSDLPTAGSTASGVIRDIPVGAVRTVAISAYPALAGDPEGAVVISRGQTDVAIDAGQLATASITLLPVLGDVAVSATFPAGDIDVPRVHHVSVVATGARISAPTTFYLTPNLTAFTAAGTAQKTPVGISRVITVKSFTSDGTLLHQGSST